MNGNPTGVVQVKSVENKRAPRLWSKTAWRNAGFSFSSSRKDLRRVLTEREVNFGQMVAQPYEENGSATL